MPAGWRVVTGGQCTLQIHCSQCSQAAHNNKIRTHDYGEARQQKFSLILKFLFWEFKNLYSNGQTEENKTFNPLLFIKYHPVPFRAFNTLTKTSWDFMSHNIGFMTWWLYHIKLNIISPLTILLSTLWEKWKWQVYMGLSELSVWGDVMLSCYGANVSFVSRLISHDFWSHQGLMADQWHPRSGFSCDINKILQTVKSSWAGWRWRE